MKKNLAIILAGGTGSRLSGELPKQFLMLHGKTVLHHTLEKFESHNGIHDIFLVSHGDFIRRAETVVKESSCKKVRKIMKGGHTRQDSSRIGVCAADPAVYENVLIHDAARPFISHDIIDDILAHLNRWQAVNVAIPSADTIVQVDAANRIETVPDRRFLRRVQTPQAFKLQLIQKAHHLALEKHITQATDDCSLILNLELAEIIVVPGSETNIKITYPPDLAIAETILATTR